MFADACLSFHRGSAQLFYKLLFRHLFAHFSFRICLYANALRIYSLVTLGRHIEL